MTRPVTRVRTRRMVLALAAAAIAVSGCTDSTGPDRASGTTQKSGSFTAANAPIATPNLQLVSALEPFTACDDLLRYVKEAASERVGPYGFNQWDQLTAGRAVEDSTSRPPVTGTVPNRGPVTSMSPTTAAPPAASPSDGSNTGQKSTGATGTGESETTAPEHSDTNVQEKGVDEPDTIKTDGKRILATSGNRLLVVNVEGAAPVTLGSITLPGNGTSQMLVSGNHVLAINSGYIDDGFPDSGSRGASESSYYAGVPSTLLSIIDVGDPANLKVLNSLRVDGSFVSARMVEGQARVVTSSAPAGLPFVNPSAYTAAAHDAATKANKAIIEGSKIEDWLPVAHLGGSSPTDKPLLDCAKISHPKTFSGFGTLAVLSVDVNANEVNPADAVGIMADGQTVYASKANLYVSTPAYIDPPRPATPTPPGTTPGTAGTTPAPVPPTTIARAPIPLKSTTAIHKFDISAKGPAVYRASGEVEGSLLSQFSLSEDDGLLRVATTTTSNDCGANRCGSTESFVRVLQEVDGELKQIGQVGNMGHGEQVKAVRFVGKQGYVVTFRQTDPLYTLDLSTPTAPRIVGELKILGYSAYLHPMGDNLLIGIGQDATATGRTTGTKVALFDVSDLANPREIQQYVLMNSTSEVEQDFKAFTFWEPTKLAVIPVDRAYMGFGGCPNPGPTGGVCAPETSIAPFTGAIGLTIDRNGIGELGRIVNPGGGYSPIPECQRTGQCVPAPCPPDAKCSGVVPVGGAVPDGKNPAAVDCTVAACTSSTGTPVPTTQPGSPPRPTIPPCPPTGDTTPGGGCPVYNGDLGSRIERSVVVGDSLFTFSANGLKQSDLTTLHEEFWLPFF